MILCPLAWQARLQPCQRIAVLVVEIRQMFGFALYLVLLGLHIAKGNPLRSSSDARQLFKQAYSSVTLPSAI